MMNTSKRKKQVKSTDRSGGFWYVRHPEVRKSAARARARGIAKWIRTGQGLDIPPDDRALFVALHTCAHWASGGDRGRVRAQTRRIWTRRWAVIREYIVELNLGLVYSTIRRFSAQSTDDDAMLSEAMFALSRAVERFDPWKGYRFSTFACNCIIRGCIRRSRYDQRYRERFPIQYDAYLDQPVEEPDTEAALRVERLRHALARNAGNLTELESRVLAKRFPRDQEPQSTFKQIGQKLGLSKERVRQIQNAALGKLRDALEADPVLQ